MSFRSAEVTNTSTVTKNKTGATVENQSTRRRFASSRPKVNFSKIFKSSGKKSKLGSIKVNTSLSPRASKQLKKFQSKGIKTKQIQTPTSKKISVSHSGFRTATKTAPTVRTNFKTSFSPVERITSNNTPSIKSTSTGKPSSVFTGSTNKNNANLSKRLDAIADKLNLPRGSTVSNDDISGFIGQGGIKPLGFDSLFFNPKSETGFSVAGQPIARVKDPDSSTGFSFLPASQDPPFNPFEALGNFLFGGFQQPSDQPSTSTTTNIFEPVTLSQTDDEGEKIIPEDTQGNIFGGASGDTQSDGDSGEGFLSGLINDPVKLGIGIVAVITLLLGVTKS